MTEGERIRAFVRAATTEQASQATRAVSLGVLAGVVMRTPVDTGRARGGWVTSIGQPTGADPRRLDRGGAVAVSEGSQVIAGQRGLQQVSLENNVMYIGRLEDGSSRQAPSGMVAETLAGMGLSPGRSG